jgi:hypothetical protein
MIALEQASDLCAGDGGRVRVQKGDDEMEKLPDNLNLF